MDPHQVISHEESLREAASLGDLDKVRELIRSGVDVNCKNAVNGWTPLHWAARRGHKPVIMFLLSCGANKDIRSMNNELPASVTTDETIHMLLEAENVTPNISNLPITPHYLSNPEWPYAKKVQEAKISSNGRPDHNLQVIRSTSIPNSLELLLKIRVANCDDRDFIEVDLDRTSLTYDALLTLMCDELKVQKSVVQKIRKLPNTIVRNDKDVKRLVDTQELELVVATAVNNTSQYHSLTKAKPQNTQILY